MGDPSGAISVRQLNDNDSEGACAVINVAARWYKEFLPAGEYHDPEMTVEEWSAEAGRLTWFGAFATGKLVGVMGLEYLKGVALLRHAYVLVEHQQEGIGSLLREHLEGTVEGTRRIIVGTYEGNYKARRMLEAAAGDVVPGVVFPFICKLDADSATNGRLDCGGVDHGRGERARGEAALL